MHLLFNAHFTGYLNKTITSVESGINTENAIAIFRVNFGGQGASVVWNHSLVGKLHWNWKCENSVLIPVVSLPFHLEYRITNGNIKMPHIFYYGAAY